MKDDIYDVTCAFTKDSLVCVMCNCKIGSCFEKDQYGEVIRDGIIEVI